MIADLIRKNRSCRRFYEDQPVEMDQLEDLVNLARLSASAANLQPLRYILCTQPELGGRIFSCLAWAADLKDWPGPQEGERPAAYIVMLSDSRTANRYVGCDVGIAAQSILLGAREAGLAGCMIAAIGQKALRQTLGVPDHLTIELVIALGKPKERAVIDAVGDDGSIRYWRDAKGVHHVPKRSLTEVIIGAHK